MLSSAEEQRLVSQLKMVFTQFVGTNHKDLINAVLKLAVDSVELVRYFQDQNVDATDDASCGPEPPVVPARRGSEVRCPHCGRFV